MMINLYGIFGAGGFGKEVISLTRIMLKKQFNQNDYELVFIDHHLSATTVNGYRVLTSEEFFAHPAKNKFFNIAISQIAARKKIANDMLHHGAQPFRINAENFVELDHNEIAEGAIFCPFTTVTANSKIGKYFHANIYSYVAHDCIIGDYVTFAPGVHCNGNVIIENDVYVGSGAIIKQGTKEKPMIIGEGAVLGMGAIVTKSVPPFETVVGNPARSFERKPLVSI